MADVGAAETWKDPDFGTRSYSTTIQGSNAQIREMIGEVFIGMAWRPSVSISRDEPQTWSPTLSVDHHRGQFLFCSQVCQAGNNGREAGSETLRP